MTFNMLSTASLPRSMLMLASKILRAEVLDLDARLAGPHSKRAVGEKFPPTIYDRLFAVARGVDRSTYGPTPTHRRSLQIATEEMAELHPRVAAAREGLAAWIAETVDEGAPWIEGEALPPLPEAGGR